MISVKVDIGNKTQCNSIMLDLIIRNIYNTMIYF